MPSFSLSVRHFVQKGEHLLYLDQIKFGCAHHSCSIFLTFVSSVSLWSNSDVLIVNGLLMLFHFFVMFFHSFINIPSWNSAFSWDYPSPLVIWIRVSHFSFSCVSEHNEVHSIPKEGYFCISSWIVCFFCSISHLIFGFSLLHVLHFHFLSTFINSFDYFWTHFAFMSLIPNIFLLSSTCTSLLQTLQSNSASVSHSHWMLHVSVLMLYRTISLLNLHMWDVVGDLRKVLLVQNAQ